MTFECCTSRTDGFHSIVDPDPNIDVLVGPDCKANDELTMNAMLDAFPTHPELNAYYGNGGAFFGVQEALKAMDRYYPIGDPRHVIWTGQDDFPTGLDAIHAGFCDGLGHNSAWFNGDNTGQAIVNYLMLGKSVPKAIRGPMYAVTPENVDKPAYKGAPCRWGDMYGMEPEPSKWPLLDLTEYGMPFPSYAEKLAQQ